jgi:hypothetical protein
MARRSFYGQPDEGPASRREPVPPCGHHYHASLAALLAAGANVEDLTMTTAQPSADHAVAPA